MMPAILLIIVALECLLIGQTMGLPLTTENAENERMMVELAPNSGFTDQDNEVMDAMAEFSSQLENGEMKTLYKHQVSFERLADDMNIPSFFPLPKYIVTREEKAYFFDASQLLGLSNGADRIESPSYGDSDTSSGEDKDVVQHMFNIVRKHTNNPPGWTRRIRASNYYDKPAKPVVKGSNSK